MIQFFRRIRKGLIAKSKMGKYLQYAIGEIILVMIGILMALQINNWNTERMERIAISNYYERIHKELQNGIRNIDRYIERTEPLISQNRRTLEILDSGNRDSIPALKKTLGALGTMWTLTLRFPVTDEFLSQGYLSKIENDSIKGGLMGFTYAIEGLAVNNKYTIDQYNTTIEPFFNRHINYSRVAMEQYRTRVVMGGPEINYESLFNNLELWNTVTFKLENLNGERKTISGCKSLLNWLDKQIMKELDTSESEAL